MQEPEELLLPLTSEQREVLETAVAAFQFELALSAEAQAKLAARGFTPETVRGARLGVVTADSPLLGTDWLAGWLAIPYLDKHGSPLTVRFRCMEAHEHSGHGKYMSLKHDPARVFNVGAIHRGVASAGAIHITEGELDTLILQQCGLHAIAIPGASGWRPHHAVMVAGFDRVWVWGDPDKAGQEFTSKVMKDLRHAKRVPLKNGDANETYLKDGRDGVLALIGE